MESIAPPSGQRWRPGFWSLIVTQFQGAFSDQALQNLVIFLIVGLGLSQKDRDLLIPLVGALFALPFILFSMIGGFLADRYSKRSVMIGVKGFEILIMTVAMLGLWSNSLPTALAAIFCMGVHSAVFGPSKYGALPELVPQQRLSWGNGILELGTFLAIIGGTMAGGYLSELFNGRQVWSGLALVVLACVGLTTSFGITRVPPANAGKHLRLNFFSDFFSQVAAIRRDRVLWLAVLGNTYFFFLGALLKFNIVIYGTDVLKLSETRVTYLFAALAVGIGVGSLAAGYLSGNKIEYGLIPLGAIGITVFGVLLGRPDLTFGGALANLALLGFFSGFFVVPINALIQHRPAVDQRGGVIAAANLLSFVGVFLASAAYFGMASALHWTAPVIFLAGAIMTVATTVYVLILLPDALLRLLLWLLTNSIYRIRVDGREHIPAKGGALFVCNHLSFIDALLLLAATDRPIRFLMFKGIYEKPIVKPFARAMRAIPISSQLRPREMIRSLRAASDAIKDGEVVCIFAEGQITRIGQMLPFRRGFERIMKGVDAPIIPVHLDGVWGSIFSFERGRVLWKMPHNPMAPMTVSFGRAMPAQSTATEVRQAVQELHSESFRHRRTRMLPLHRSLIRAARRHPFRFAMADGRTPRLRFGSALTRTIFLARRLRMVWRNQEMVGILMPPSVPGALLNYAALLMGKIPVNLNYTASDEILESCAAQCNIRTVITSVAFLERVKLKVPAQTVLLEELVVNPRFKEKIVALAMKWFLPAFALEKALGWKLRPSIDDLATVIFSSGSTGDPKGVMLSHFNIASNVEQLGQTFALGRNDRILGILPFFHSFGFTGTLCLPVALQFGVVYHPSPLDARVIGALVQQYAVTFLLATPTFLQTYLRRCSAEDFGSLQYVMVGAEKLPERLALSFEDKFGVRPLEGYGCTECSPVVTVNTRDYRAAGFRQVGAKRGKIGHPLPGVSVRIVDPETRQPVPVGTAGLLLVRGPNIMQGYLGRPEKTAEVLQDGWYVTGDIATVDEDGFLAITDRLTRFSKIGGEMVPHVKIEEKLHELAGVTEQTFVVTSVPDAKKGERLAVLHTLQEEALRACLEKLPQVDLPNLWIPRSNQFFHVQTLPYLGTGKMDLRKVKEMALAFSADS